MTSLGAERAAHSRFSEKGTCLSRRYQSDGAIHPQATESVFSDSDVDGSIWEEPAAAPGGGAREDDDATAGLVPPHHSSSSLSSKQPARASWRWLHNPTLRRIVDECLQQHTTPKDTDRADPSDPHWRLLEQHTLIAARISSPREAPGGPALPTAERPALCRRLVFPDGSVYAGECRHSVPHGLGAWASPLGTRYQGGWARGLQSGRGVMTWADGSKYEGDWEDGLRHGRGVFSAPDGATYAGHYRADQKCGYGACIWPDGSRYVGDFADDKPHSRLGRWYSPKRGAMYSGCVEGGTRTGLGIYSWTGGRRTAVRSSRSHRRCGARWEREGKGLAVTICRRLLASVGLAK